MELSKLAERAVSAQFALDDAHADEMSAEAELVSAIIESAKPGLRAICSSVRVGFDTRVDSMGTTYKTSTWRGLYLGDESDRVGPVREREHRDDNRGRYVGSDFFLREDGVIVRVEYNGRWSQWQGEVCAWEAVEHVYENLREACEFEAITPDVVGSAIERAFTRVIEGGALKTAATKRARAEKLRAITSLLKK